MVPKVTLRTFILTLLTFGALVSESVHAKDVAALQPQVPAGAASGTPQTTTPQPSLYKKANCGSGHDDYTVNFEDISLEQLIKFISKISGTNYIYNSEDLLNITITIVSEDSTSVEDLSAALLQILKMHQFTVSEQGNNVLIYHDQNMSKVSRVITDDNVNESCDTAIITRVFKLYHVDPVRISMVVKNLVSPTASVETSIETNHLIVTDITANVNKIADLLSALDTVSIEKIDVAEYSVQHADAQTLAEYAREILTPFAQGADLKIVPETVSKKIFIISTPGIITRAMQILQSLDAPDITSLNPPPVAAHINNNQLYMYKLKYQDGGMIADAMHEIGVNLQYTGVANIDFVNAIYTIQWIEANNSIVITGTTEAVKKVIALLDDLDQMPKQVFIEVLVLDTTLSNSLDFGVQWIALGDEQNKLAFATGLLGTGAPVLEGSSTTNPGARYVNAQNGPTLVPPAIPNAGRDVSLPNPSNLVGLPGLSSATEAFGLGLIGNIISHGGQSFLTLGALLSALDEESDTTIVLNPRIMVEDSQPASFFVGQNIPYQTTSTVIQQTGSVTQNIQYEDIGVQLQVTPMIAPNNMVTLQINQSVASVAGVIGNTLTPTTNKTLASTRVHIPDGTFLVMSGQITDTVTFIKSGIPCLGTLPLIGPAFSRTIEQRSKRNLIFFIRPKVITNFQEGIDLTNEEGYCHNWGSSPCSILECGPEKAPECETYPSPFWPPEHPCMPQQAEGPWQDPTYREGYPPHNQNTRSVQQVK